MRVTTVPLEVSEAILECLDCGAELPPKLKTTSKTVYRTCTQCGTKWKITNDKEKYWFSQYWLRTNGDNWCV